MPTEDGVRSLTAAEQEAQRRRERDEAAVRERQERERASREESERRERLRAEEAMRRAGGIQAPAPSVMPLTPVSAPVATAVASAAPVVIPASDAAATLPDARASLAMVLAQKAERDRARAALVGVMAAKAAGRGSSARQDRRFRDLRSAWEPLPPLAETGTLPRAPRPAPTEAILVQRPSGASKTVPLSMARPEVRESAQRAAVDRWLAARERGPMTLGQQVRIGGAMLLVVVIILLSVILLASG
ncbi:MAG: hypothetical protein QM753_18445 [Thermomicrobiales bacterium]